MNGYELSFPTRGYINVTPLTTASKRSELDLETLKKRELFQSLKEQIRLKECRKRLEKMQEAQEERRLLGEQEEYQYFGKGGAGGIRRDHFGRVITSKKPHPSLIANLYGRECYNVQNFCEVPAQVSSGNETEMLAMHHGIKLLPELVNAGIVGGKGAVTEGNVGVMNGVSREELNNATPVTRRRSRGNSRMGKLQEVERKFMMEKWTPESYYLQDGKGEHGNLLVNDASAEKSRSRVQSHAKRNSRKMSAVDRMHLDERASSNEEIPIAEERRSPEKESGMSRRAAGKRQREKAKASKEKGYSKRKAVSEIMKQNRKLIRGENMRGTVASGKHKESRKTADAEQTIGSEYSSDKEEEKPGREEEQNSKESNRSQESLTTTKDELRSKKSEAMHNEREKLRSEYIKEQKRFEKMKARAMLPLAKNFVTVHTHRRNCKIPRA